eukprot:GHVU01060090.1.p1 GENE.GHVU01060090.1~~GHVU01060090.1.p1  ORF type:complete len:367 (-),score=80.14 GHVU01060090.1:2903-4003(-)
MKRFWKYEGFESKRGPLPMLTTSDFSVDMKLSKSSPPPPPPPSPPPAAATASTGAAATTGAAASSGVPSPPPIPSPPPPHPRHPHHHGVHGYLTEEGTYDRLPDLVWTLTPSSTDYSDTFSGPPSSTTATATTGGWAGQKEEDSTKGQVEPLQPWMRLEQQTRPATAHWAKLLKQELWGAEAAEQEGEAQHEESEARAHTLADPPVVVVAKEEGGTDAEALPERVPEAELVEQSTEESEGLGGSIQPPVVVPQTSVTPPASHPTPRITAAVAAAGNETEDSGAASAIESKEVDEYEVGSDQNTGVRFDIPTGATAGCEAQSGPCRDGYGDGEDEHDPLNDTNRKFGGRVRVEKTHKRTIINQFEEP